MTQLALDPLADERAAALADAERWHRECCETVRRFDRAWPLSRRWQRAGRAMRRAVERRTAAEMRALRAGASTDDFPSGDRP